MPLESPRIKTTQVGGQTLIMGDCMKILAEMEADSVDHLITDPPYEQSMQDAKNSFDKFVRSDGRTKIQTLNFESIDEIRQPFIELSQKITKKWFLAFCTTEGVGRWQDGMASTGMKYKRACTWIKPDSLPQMNGQCPASGIENFVCAWCSEPSVENFVCAWCSQGASKWNGGGKCGIYTFICNSMDRTARNKKNDSHPTEKPLILMQALIRDFTKEGDIVLDPFMGSGTTLMACEMMGRRGIGIEMNPTFYDLACRQVAKARIEPDLIYGAPEPVTDLNGEMNV